MVMIILYGRQQKRHRCKEQSLGLIDLMAMGLSELRELVMDREAWRAVVHEVAEWDTTERLNWTELKCINPPRKKKTFTERPFRFAHPLLVSVLHLANYLKGWKRVNLQFARLIPLKPSIPNLFRVLASSHLSKTLPWTATERRRSPRIRRAFMLTEKPDLQADQGSWPCFLTSFHFLLMRLVWELHPLRHAENRKCLLVH